jgi:HSP20 family molecular chaperone IbpA
MSKMPPPSSPFVLGYSEFERVLERVSRGNAENFPPCNIEEFDDGSLKVTLAVAGFAAEDLSVTVHGCQMNVAGDRNGADDARVFLHKGIAGRSFQRLFLLGHGLEVESVKLGAGLLKINLRRPDAEVNIRNYPVTPE